MRISRKKEKQNKTTQQNKTTSKNIYVEQYIFFIITSVKSWKEKEKFIHAVKLMLRLSKYLYIC